MPILFELLQYNCVAMQAKLALEAIRSKATGAKAESDAPETKWCGWCLKKNAHKLLQSRTLRSATYECAECQKSSVMCSTLDCEGMSRRWVFGMASEDAFDYSESLCLKCQGHLLVGIQFYVWSI